MPESLDPYLYLGTEVLRNIPGLRDPKQLAAFEANTSASRLIELGANPLRGRFDVAHLKSIHKFIFQDVFSWAGQFRTVNISKEHQLFGLVQFIGPALGGVLNNLANEKLLVGLGRSAFSQRAGFYLGEINAVHPFREGNGRSQREFIRELALHNGHHIVWTRITGEQMVEASIQSFKHGDSTGLVHVILKCIEP